MRFFRFVGTAMALLFSVYMSAQQIDLEEFAERIFQIQDADISYEDVYESLLLLYTDPLNLNSAKADEMASLFILSPVQVQALIEHRENTGDLLSVYELQAIPHFDLETIDKLLPFVTVEESNELKKPLIQRFMEERNKYFLLRMTRTLEEQRGYRKDEENGYLGSPEKIYGRFRASKRGDFSAGFTFEQDAGEPYKKQGVDFYSIHFMLEDQGPISKILVGDFQLQAGQGLVFGAGFNPGKGAETVNTVKRNTLGLRPYTSVLETGFFRGIGVSAPLGKVDLTVFASSLRQDGNIKVDTLQNQFETFVNSVQNSGLHRTMNELSSRDQILEFSFGGIATFRPNRKIVLGISGLATEFDTPIVPIKTPYRLFNFTGQKNQLGSIFGSYQWQNMNFFGEAARSSNGGFGITAGLLASLSRSIDLAISLRDYGKNLHSFYGNAFGETTGVQNERGVYWGVKFQPSRRYSLVAYYDKFRFPWLRVGLDAPSEGSEWLARFTCKPNREVTVFAQVREEIREVSIGEDNLSQLILRAKRNYVFNIDFRANKRLTLKTRLQTSNQDLGGVFTSGYALIQDLNYSFSKFRFSGRMAIFETDNFDNRQYSFEKDVLYAFSIPAYNGSGVRNYLLLRYTVSDNLDFWFRYARFSYRDRETVGSGLDESKGPNRSEIKWMIRWAF